MDEYESPNLLSSLKSEPYLITVKMFTFSNTYTFSYCFQNSSSSTKGVMLCFGVYSVTQPRCTNYRKSASIHLGTSLTKSYGQFNPACQPSLQTLCL